MPRATGNKCVVKTMSSSRNARVIGHFRSVPVREQSVGAQILVHLDKVQLAFRFFARARGAGFAIADNAALPPIQPDSTSGRKPRITLVG